MKYLIFLLIFLSCTKQRESLPIEPKKIGSAAILTIGNINGLISPKYVVYLNFDGDSSEKSYGPTKLDSTAMQIADRQSAVDSVRKYTAPFNILITTDRDVYNASNKHIMVVITDDYQWYGAYGGTAIIGGYKDATPCYVFPIAYNYNPMYVAIAIAHELGHEFGLLHQSVWNSDCTLSTEWNEGDENNSPIMGVVPVGRAPKWWKGTSQAGCNSFQDDAQIINSAIN